MFVFAFLFGFCLCFCFSFYMYIEKEGETESELWVIFLPGQGRGRTESDVWLIFLLGQGRDAVQHPIPLLLFLSMLSYFIQVQANNTGCTFHSQQYRCTLHDQHRSSWTSEKMGTFSVTDRSSTHNYLLLVIFHQASYLFYALLHGRHLKRARRCFTKDHTYSEF